MAGKPLAEDLPVELPLDVQASIDLVAIRSGGTNGTICGPIIGQPQLVAELKRYAPIDETASGLIALGAEPTELKATIAARTPDRVITLVASSLSLLLGPLRADAARTVLPPNLPVMAWRELGYERIATDGVQGIGSLIWAAGERVLRRLERPDLADRCRIAMLRTIVVQSSAPATNRIHRYRRIRP